MEQDTEALTPTCSRSRRLDLSLKQRIGVFVCVASFLVVAFVTLLVGGVTHDDGFIGFLGDW